MANVVELADDDGFGYGYGYGYGDLDDCKLLDPLSERDSMDLSPIIRRVEFADDCHDGDGYGYGDLDDRKLLNSLSEQDRMDLSPIIRVEFADDSHDGDGCGYGDLDDRKLLDSLSERDRMDLSPIIRVEFADDSRDDDGYGYGDLDDRKLLNSLSERDRMDLSPIIRVAFPSHMQFLHLPSTTGLDATLIRPAGMNLADLMTNHKKLLPEGLHGLKEDRSSSVLSCQEENLAEHHTALASAMALAMDGYEGGETNTCNVDPVQDMAEFEGKYDSGSSCRLLSASAKHLVSRQSPKNFNSVASAPPFSEEKISDSVSTSNPPSMLARNGWDPGILQAIGPAPCCHIPLQNPPEMFVKIPYSGMPVESLSLVQNNVPLETVENRKSSGASIGSSWNLRPFQDSDKSGDGNHDGEEKAGVFFQADSWPHEIRKDKFLKDCDSHEQIKTSSLQVHKPIIKQKGMSLQAFNSPRQKVMPLMMKECYIKCSEKSNVDSLQLSKSDKEKASTASLQVLKLQCKSQGEVEVLRNCNAHELIDSGVFRVYNAPGQMDSEVLGVRYANEQNNSNVWRVCNDQQMNPKVLRICNTHEQKLSDVSLQQIHKAQQETAQFGSHTVMVNSNMVGSLNVLSKNDYSNSFDRLKNKIDSLADPLVEGLLAKRSKSAFSCQFRCSPSSLQPVHDSNELMSLVAKEQRSSSSNLPKHGKGLGTGLNNLGLNPINANLKESRSDFVHNKGPFENWPPPGMVHVNPLKISTKILSPTWLDGDLRQVSITDKPIMPACENQHECKEHVSTNIIASTSLDHLILDMLDKSTDGRNDDAPIFSHVGCYSSINKESISNASSHEELGINWNGVDLCSGVQDSSPKGGTRIPLLSESFASILLADEKLFLSSVDYMGPSHSADRSLPSLKFMASETSESIGYQPNEYNLLDHGVCLNGSGSHIEGDNSVTSCHIEGSRDSGRRACPLNRMVHKQLYTEERDCCSNEHSSDIRISEVNQYKFLNGNAAAKVKCACTMHRERVSSSFCTKAVAKQRKLAGKGVCGLERCKTKTVKERKGVANLDPNKLITMCSNAERISKAYPTLSSAISHCKKHHATVNIEVQAGEKRQRTLESSVNDLPMSRNEKHASSLSEVLLSMLVESGYGGLTAREVLKKLSEVGKLGLLGSAKPQALQVKMILRTLPNVRELPGCRFAINESCVEGTTFGNKVDMIERNDKESTPLHLTQGKTPKNYRAKGKFHSLARKVLKLSQHTDDKDSVGTEVDEKHKAHLHGIERKSSYDCSLNSPFCQPRWQRHGKRAKTRERRVASKEGIRAAELPVGRMPVRKKVPQLRDAFESQNCKEEQTAADQSLMLVSVPECRQTSEDDQRSMNEVAMTVGRTKMIRPTCMRELANLLSSTAVVDRRCSILNGKDVVSHRLTQQKGSRQSGSNVLEMDLSIRSGLEREQTAKGGETQTNSYLLENQMIPGHCCKTDGKKWRCLQDAEVGSKYCKRHKIKAKKV